MEYRRRNSAIHVRDEYPPSGPPRVITFAELLPPEPATGHHVPGTGLVHWE
jgi:hypothetical protein